MEMTIESILASCLTKGETRRRTSVNEINLVPVQPLDPAIEALLLSILGPPRVKRTGEPKFRNSQFRNIVISERKCESFDVYLNGNFTCAGGYKLNPTPETYHGAKKLAEKVSLVLKSKGVKFAFVENLLDAELAPHERTVKEEIETPKWDTELHYKSKLFLFWIQVAKLRLEKGTAYNVNLVIKLFLRSIGRKYNRANVMSFHDVIVRLKNQVKINLAMQSILIKNFGTPKLPDLGTIQVP